MFAVNPEKKLMVNILERNVVYVKLLMCDPDLLTVGVS